MCVKRHPFGFQPKSLHLAGHVVAGALAYFATGIDNAMPRYRFVAESAEGIADLASPSRQARQQGDLTIGSHLPARDARDDGVDVTIDGRSQGFPLSL